MELSLVQGKNRRSDHKESLPTSKPSETRPPSPPSFLSRVRWVRVGVDAGLLGGTVVMAILAQRENATAQGNYEIYQTLTYIDDPETYYQQTVEGPRKRAGWLLAGSCTTGAALVGSVLFWPVISPTSGSLGLGLRATW